MKKRRKLDLRKIKVARLNDLSRIQGGNIGVEGGDETPKSSIPCLLSKHNDIVVC